MTDYSQMSDLEINGLIAIKTQKPGDWTQARGKTFIHEYADAGAFKGICIGWKEFDPCNNPADAWPIIIENKIAIIPDSADGEWVAFNEFTLYEGDWMFASDPERHVNGSNPLRVAMIVFLMMKGAIDAPAI